MKKLLQKLFVGGVGAISLIACSVESIDQEMTALNASTSTMEVQEIVAGDLVGTWKLSSMLSDTVVDLNNDSTYATDVLKETDCFKEMSFTFHENGDIDTRQAKLYFETESGAMECKYKDYQATYDVDGDQLMVTFTFNGTSMTEAKTISLYSNENGQFLQVSLEYYETEGYIPTNPETSTGAENIDLLEMVYKKVQ